MAAVERNAITILDASPHIMPTEEYLRAIQCSVGLEMFGWKLECLHAAVPHEFCPSGISEQLGAGGAHRLLKVGRTVQPLELWERLLPSEAWRNTVSREHFEVHYCSVGAPGFRLRNLSSQGTFLNGQLVHQEAVLRLGDLVAVGEIASEYGSKPALHLRFAPSAPDAPRPMPQPASMLALSPQPRATPDRTVAPMSPALQPQPGPLADVCLQCIEARGSPALEGAAVPLQVAVVPGAAMGILRVGRAWQAMAFWEAAVSDAALRNTVSREHFEVHLLEPHQAAAETTPALTLVNCSSAGTLVNGAMVRERAALKPGDIIAVPRPREAGEGGATAQFRVCAAAAEARRAEPPSTDPFHVAVAAGPLAVADTPPRPARQPAPVPAWPAAKGGPGFPQPAVATQADEGPVPIVKISCAALPPPFTLSCTSSRGLPGLDLSCLPRAARVLEASCLNAHLRVGRNIQPTSFWASLLPDEALRHAIGPDHFEVAISDEGEILLTNLSPNGTLVNGKRVVNWVSLESGDTISATLSLQDHSPIISFSLCFAGDLEFGATESAHEFESLQVGMRCAQSTPFDSIQVAGGQPHARVHGPHQTRLHGADLQPHLTPLDGSMPVVPLEGHVTESSPRLLAANSSFAPRVGHAGAAAKAPRPRFGYAAGNLPAYQTQPLR